MKALSVCLGMHYAWFLILLSCHSRPVVAQRVTDIRLSATTAVFDIPDERFTEITSVRELRDGRVLVADRRENRVVLVDFANAKATPIARTGDGPGEYRRVGQLSELSGDSSLLADVDGGRWIILHGSQVVETIPPQRAFAASLGIMLSGSDRFGRVLGAVGLSFSSRGLKLRETADSIGLVLGDRSSLTLDTIARLRGRGQAGLCIAARGSRSRNRVPCNPLASEDLALLFTDGWIAVAKTEPYRVDWRTSDGRWIRGQPLQRDTVRVDDTVKCAVLALRSGVGASSCEPNGYEWPQIVPPFLAASSGMVGVGAATLLAAPNGNVLIRQFSPTTRAPTEYYLVDRRGSLVGTLALPSDEAVVGFGSSAVYVAKTDAFGLQSLRRHRWP
jgi:hypothetical protein